jgi:hypothetical protein
VVRVGLVGLLVLALVAAVVLPLVQVLLLALD